MTLPLLFLAGCALISDADLADRIDGDDDGFSSEQYGGTDCDDADPDVNPDAPEVWYDGVDADCDDRSDYDQDGDGFDAEAHGGTDCDDDDAAVHPDVPWYADEDEDGFGDPDSVVAACVQPEGYLADDQDCDDGNAAVHPGATELCNGLDDDCDPATPEHVFPGGYASLQLAVDAAAPGGLVCVEPGTWQVEVEIDHPVVLAPMVPSASTVLESVGGSTRVIHVTAGAGGTVIQGLRIEKGQASVGSGVLAEADVTLRDVVVALHSGPAGTSAVEATASVLIEDSSLNANEGTALRVHDAPEVVLRRTIVSNNQADAVAGLELDGVDTVELDDVVVDGNLASFGTAGVDVDDFESLALTDVTFIDNAGGSVGGLRVRGRPGHGTVDLTRGTFRLNEGGTGAGAMQLDAGAGASITLVARASAFVANGSGLAGGGLRADEAELDLENVGFVGNFAPRGSAVYLEESQGTVTNVDISFNESVGFCDTGCGAFVVVDSGAVVISYSNTFMNDPVDYSGIESPGENFGNVTYDPDYVTYQPNLDPALWDFHLKPLSYVREGGDPSISDPDGSVSDIGAFGGPHADFAYYEDADTDGLPDGWESLHDLPPGSGGPEDDPDADGLTNAQELSYGTSPTRADTDGDGYSDGHEVTYGTDPLNPTLL